MRIIDKWSSHYGSLLSQNGKELDKEIDIIRNAKWTEKT